MFEIGWSEMLVIAVVMIVVVGPKDLPKMLRTFGRTAAKLRTMAGDFQKQFNEALKEAELDDVKKSVDELRNLNPINDIKKQLNPFEKAAADVRAGIEGLKETAKPSAPPQPAAPAAVATSSEPLKNGATAMPGSEPATTAATPVVAAAEIAPAALAASSQASAEPAKVASAAPKRKSPAEKPAKPPKPAAAEAPKSTRNAVAAGTAKAKAVKPKKSAGTPT